MQNVICQKIKWRVNSKRGGQVKAGTNLSERNADCHSKHVRSLKTLILQECGFKQV